MNAVTLRRDFGGCTSAPTISIAAPASGAAATATATITAGYHELNGFLTTVRVTTPGSGYTSNPAVTVSGGGCAQIIAVADIQRAVFDYGDSSGYVWNLANAGMAQGPFYVGKESLTQFSTTSRLAGLTFLLPASANEVGMMNSYNQNHVTYSNNFVHGWRESTVVAGQPEGDAGMIAATNGQSRHFGVLRKLRLRWRYVYNLYLAAGAAWSPAISLLGRLGNTGGADVENNYAYGVRHGIYNGTAITANNEMWNIQLSCCGGHGDAFYWIPAPNATIYAYNNIVHDLEGGAGIFLTKGNGDNYWLFNNVFWGVGSSTPPVGVDDVFNSGPGVSHFYFYNNSFFAQYGTNSCITIGNTAQANPYPHTMLVELRNNLCITTQTGYHWWSTTDPTTVTNGGQTLAQIDAANLVIAPHIRGFARLREIHYQQHSDAHGNDTAWADDEQRLLRDVRHYGNGQQSDRNMRHAGRVSVMHGHQWQSPAIFGTVERWSVCLHRQTQSSVTTRNCPALRGRGVAGALSTKSFHEMDLRKRVAPASGRRGHLTYSDR